MKKKHNKFIPDDQFLRDNGILFPKIGIKIDEDGIYTFTWENYNTKEDFQKFADYIGLSLRKLREKLSGFCDRAKRRHIHVDYKKSRARELSEYWDTLDTIKLTEISKELGIYGKPRDGSSFPKGSDQRHFASYVYERNKTKRDIEYDSILPILRPVKKYDNLVTREDFEKEIIKNKIINSSDFTKNHNGLRYALERNNFQINQFEDCFISVGHSSNEGHVKVFLDNNNIFYKSHEVVYYKGRKLIPDFIINLANYKIMLEPGGSQHISEKSLSGLSRGKGVFKDRINLDKLKFQWAIENNILPLYWLNIDRNRSECFKILENGYMNGKAIYFLKKEDYFNFILELKNLLEDNPEEYSDFSKLTDLAMKLYQTKQNKGA
jgi:hypothetical protein